MTIAAGQRAPGSATTTRSPTAKLGCPQTISRCCDSPTSTRQARSASEFGELSISVTHPTSTAVDGPRATTLRPRGDAHQRQLEIGGVTSILARPPKRLRAASCTARASEPPRTATRNGRPFDYVAHVRNALRNCRVRSNPIRSETRVDVGVIPAAAIRLDAPCRSPHSTQSAPPFLLANQTSTSAEGR